MKKVILAIAVITLLASCSSWQKIGTLTVASTRNFETQKKYTCAARYVDSSKLRGRVYRNIRSSEPLQDAINKAVESVPGGEYMANVTIYTNGRAIKVIGDVWAVDTIR